MPSRVLGWSGRLACALGIVWCFTHVAIAESTSWVGVMREADTLMYGQGVPQDRGKAAVQYERACSAGVQDACAELTEILYWGHPQVPQDKVRAIQLMTSLLPYLEAACRDRNPRACLRLGAAYADGIGVQQDRVRAAALDVLACDGGFMEGCFYLGVAHAKGRGVKPDRTKAAGLYRQACDGGYAAACVSLSHAYKEGDGLEKNDQRAASLREKACSLGWPSDCEG